MAGSVTKVGLKGDEVADHPLLAKAKQEYPFIAQYNPAIKFTPREDAGYAETFPPGEEGYGEFTRPKEFPMQNTGVEIYNPSFTHHDLAAEFLHVDPVANKTRNELIKTFTPRQLEILKEQPDYVYGEGLNDERRLNNATDGLLRGYTVGQWPSEAIQDFRLSDDQYDRLNRLRTYMTTPQSFDKPGLRQGVKK